MSEFYKKAYVLLVGALILFALYNVVQVSGISGSLEEKLAIAKEDARPADIELVVITADCEDCYDIDSVVSVVKSSGVNIVSEKTLDFSSSEGQAVVSKYNIDSAPSLVLTGELAKAKTLSFKLKDAGAEETDDYIIVRPEPPFVETESGNVRGRITVILIEKSDCDDCTDLQPIINQFALSGLKIKEQRNLDYDSSAAREWVDKYDIEKIPVVIMDEEATVYPNIAQGWTQYGTIESDGTVIMRVIGAPYYSVKEGAIRGLVSLTYLVDGSCEECYEPDKFHEPILNGLKVVVADKKTIDASSPEGASLIGTYEIEKLPTVILTGDVGEYANLVRAWQSAGSVESDGAYVFRKVEFARQAYLDLTTGEVVDPTQRTG